MPGWLKQPALRLASLAFASVFICLVGTTDAAFATTAVTVNVPIGFIVVQGKSSPGAHIEIYENGNELPAASIVADSSGVFSEELPQDNTGLVDIGIQATDTLGKENMFITKSVAVIAQQTSTLTVLLPPTITVNPEVVIFRTGTLEFTGQTIPNATVRVTVEPSTVVTITSDSDGRYAVPFSVQSLPSVGIYAFGVEVKVGSEMSEYVTAGTFIVSPPVKIPYSPPGRPFQGIINRITRPDITVPKIISPEESELVSTAPIVLRGKADPGAIVTLYDGDSAIGGIVAGENGEWQYYFSPYKENHVISAISCLDGRCSKKSRTIKITRPKTNQLPMCRQGVILNSYRFTSKTDAPFDLRGTLPKGSNGILYISWGDGMGGRFERPRADTLEVSHVYNKAGIYSGYAILHDSNACQTATYFAVEARDPISRTNVAFIVMTIVVGTISLGSILLRILAIKRFKPSPRST